MPPRARNEGLDATPILTHYLFLFTSILAIVPVFLISVVSFPTHPFFTARVVPCICLSVPSHSTEYVPVDLSLSTHNLTTIFKSGGRSLVGNLWFAIFLQLFLILGVLYTLATDSIAMHRLQISVFGAVAIVFAVEGVTNGLFAAIPSLNAMGSGWLLLAIVDILWVLYFTSEEDSLALHIFNMLGNGGLSSPSRRRRTRTQSAMHDIPSGNGYPTNYTLGGGIGSHDAYDSKIGGGAYASPNTAIRNQSSFAGSLNDNIIKGGTGGTGPASIHNQTSAGSISGVDNGPSSPLMVGVGAGDSRGSNVPSSNLDQPPLQVTQQPEKYLYKAKALYACKLPPFLQFAYVFTLY